MDLIATISTQLADAIAVGITVTWLLLAALLVYINTRS